MLFYHIGGGGRRLFVSTTVVGKEKVARPLFPAQGYEANEQNSEFNQEAAHGLRFAPPVRPHDVMRKEK